MVRLNLGSDAKVAFGGSSGRGAWLCRGSPHCVELAIRRRAVARALRAEVDDEDVARLYQAYSVGERPGGAASQVCEDGMPGGPAAARPHERQGT